jgi:hypothetical protein
MNDDRSITNERRKNNNKMYNKRTHRVLIAITSLVDLKARKKRGCIIKSIFSRTYVFPLKAE